MSGDASYARMLWKMARDAHFDPEQDCECPDCVEEAAQAESEWRRDWEAAA